MTNYYQTLIVGDLLIDDTGLNQLNGNLLLKLNNSKIIELKDGDAYLNNNRITTTNDTNDTNSIIKLTFGSGIYMNDGKKFLRYCGNSDSGYDTELRVSNIYNSAFPLKIKKISIQKGYAGDTIINIPILNYSKVMTGNFLTESVEYNLEANTQLYIEIDGVPSLETMVELYVEEISDTADLIEANQLTFNSSSLPTFNELFNYTNGYVETKHPISII